MSKKILPGVFAAIAAQNSPFFVRGQVPIEAIAPDGSPVQAFGLRGQVPIGAIAPDGSIQNPLAITGQVPIVLAQDGRLGTPIEVRGNLPLPLMTTGGSTEEFIATNLEAYIATNLPGVPSVRLAAFNAAATSVASSLSITAESVIDVIALANVGFFPDTLSTFTDTSGTTPATINSTIKRINSWIGVYNLQTRAGKTDPTIRSNSIEFDLSDVFIGTIPANTGTTATAIWAANRISFYANGASLVVTNTSAGADTISNVFIGDYNLSATNSQTFRGATRSQITDYATGQWNILATRFDGSINNIFKDSFKYANASISGSFNYNTLWLAGRATNQDGNYYIGPVLHFSTALTDDQIDIASRFIDALQSYGIY